MSAPARPGERCDETCTVDCGHCKGSGTPADHGGFKVGDHVRIGRGKTEWVIDRFWGERDQFASLEPVVGYSGTSVLVSRLRAVA